MNRIIRASARASLLAAALTFAAALPAFATVVTAIGSYSNDADPLNMATGFPNGPFNLTSTNTGATTTYSYVDFFPTATFSLNNITGLTANFTDTLGGSQLGAPRFVVGLANGNFYSVYLGPPPSFAQSSPSAFTTAFSGLNLVNATNDTGFENTGTYKTFADFQASADGSQIVTDVAFVLDGANATSNQALTLNSFSVQFLAAPEPATWTMMAAALGLLGFLVARRRRNSAGAIAA